MAKSSICRISTRLLTLWQQRAIPEQVTATLQAIVAVASSHKSFSFCPLNGRRSCRAPFGKAAGSSLFNMASCQNYTFRSVFRKLFGWVDHDGNRSSWLRALIPSIQLVLRQKLPLLPLFRSSSSIENTRTHSLASFCAFSVFAKCSLAYWPNSAMPPCCSNFAAT